MHFARYSGARECFFAIFVTELELQHSVAENCSKINYEYIHLLYMKS